MCSKSLTAKGIVKRVLNFVITANGQAQADDNDWGVLVIGGVVVSVMMTPGWNSKCEFLNTSSWLISSPIPTEMPSTVKARPQDQF